MVWQKPREIAAAILLQHGSSRGYLEDLLNRELASTRLHAPDRALVQELCYGVVRWRSTLDWLIQRRAHQRTAAPDAQVLMRLGLYQLFWLDRIPAHAAVHETIEAGKALQLQASSGFINALLRNYLREADATRAALRELQTTDPATGWSHPRWLVDRWKARLKPEELTKLLEWNNAPASVFARINTLKADAAQVIEAWRNEGVQYDFGRWDWIGENLVFHLRKHPPLEKLQSFNQGWFYVQDPSTLLAVHLLGPQPGEKLLDLCAAPGGKATMIAQTVDNDATLIAVEPDAKRRARLQENCDRLGADIRAVPPTDPLTAGPFDAILVDAPCSNSGVLRRRLDVRWRLMPGDIERCRKVQLEILQSAWPRVRPGGRLVYSTCSVEPEENEELLVAFLAKEPTAKLRKTRFLHPARDGVDGAFAARLEKT